MHKLLTHEIAQKLSTVLLVNCAFHNIENYRYCALSIEMLCSSLNLPCSFILGTYSPLTKGDRVFFVYVIAIKHVMNKGVVIY